MANTEDYEKTAIMFADVAGSTSLYEKEGDQRAQEIMDRCLSIVADTVKACGGSILRYKGDEVMCRFVDEDSAVGTAVKIQEALEASSKQEALPSVRIGLHYGMAINKHGEVFGDAVNVAARVASIAKGKQIITTQDTVRNLSAEYVKMTREFDRAPMKGKEDEVTIYEVLWQTEDVTRMHTVLNSGDKDASSLLSIMYDGNEYNINANAADFLIGRDERCDLIIHSDYSSRVHAHIEYRRGKFVLVDESTNGTYITIEKEKEIYLRREELPLLGNGVIGIGESATDANQHLIRYVCV